MQPPSGPAGLSEELRALAPFEREIITFVRLRGPLSRSDLARLTGYSRASITPVVERLVQRGMLLELGAGASQGGRRPRLLGFNQRLGYVAGVELGPASLDLALADCSGQIVERYTERADVRGRPEELLGRIAVLLSRLLARRGIPLRQLCGVGLGLPGPVEFSSGRLVAPLLMPRWDGVPIPAFVRQAFPSALVAVDNDVNLMALGELCAGAGRGVASLIFLKIGTGIGAGIVCQGQIYRGSSGCAGEIGHISVERGGPLCYCGNTGCLELLAAGPAIVARALELAQSGLSPGLAELRAAQGGQLSVEDVGIAAAAGDHAALKVIQDCGRVIGETLAGLVNFFNPRLILIGGAVSASGYQLLASVRQTVLQRSLPLATRDLQIDYNLLGAEAGVIGAVWLALEQVFATDGMPDQPSRVADVAG